MEILKSQKDDSFLKEITEHNYQINDPLEISKLKKRNNMKRKCIEAVTESPLSIVIDIMSGDPSDIIICTGMENALTKMIRRYRAPLVNLESIAHPDFAIDEKLKISKRKEQFYRYGPGNYCSLPIYENIAIFFTDSMISILHKEKVWSIDGTSYIVPKPYYQLYTISIIKNHHVVPVI
ncbi:hypothetical protein A3Q56_02416 [Intoshia linei]|uniref:Uncharacterized protein n=1 Tax=Intoshia linei TaxID=1819745 RepID=A0A177B6M6_9BILA|nr:hypothetical protein A3Q56_02416 [Intoshia linei]